MSDSGSQRPRLSTDGTLPAPTAPQASAPTPAPMAYQQPQVLQHQGGLPQGVGLAGVGSRLGAALLDSLLLAVTFGIGWLIWAAIISGKGQTPGKQLLKLRVVDATTAQPIGFGRMFFMRGLVAGLVASIAIPFTIGILLFMPFWDRRNQTLWDKVSGTVVVSDPNNAWSLV